MWTIPKDYKEINFNSLYRMLLIIKCFTVSLLLNCPNKA